MTRLHLVALPHTQSTRDFTTCAFTAKLCKFAEMMGDRYEIIVYSGEHNDAPCVEHVALFTDAEQRAWYGERDPNLIPSAATWNAEDECWRIMNARAIAAIAPRLDERDIILILGGGAQRAVADAFPHVLSCEWAAGYSGIFSPFVCFESYAWRHYLYGVLGCDGRWFDTVIPNFFRPSDFQVANEKDDYLLFVGRLVQRKGVQVAVELAKHSGRRLLLAGSGVVEASPGRIICEEMTLEGDHLEYVGTVEIEERNRLMGRAHAVLVPTTYIEPFGAVAVEAQLCGTPAITTDWGAFTETCASEFRFRNLAEGLAAIKRAGDVDPASLRENALARYSLDAVAPMYDRWFRQLLTLWGDGYYELDDTSAKTKETANA